MVNAILRTFFIHSILFTYPLSMSSVLGIREMQVSEGNSICVVESRVMEEVLMKYRIGVSHFSQGMQCQGTFPTLRPRGGGGE